ncbi:MAG: metal ABC transporter permease [Puniceicoccaceae bacterium]
MDWTRADWDFLWRVLTLADHNTRLVTLSTALLGGAAGVIGTFLLLRKRSLMGDTFAHACLPGIGLGFMVMVALGGSGKWLPGLLIGAGLTGLLGVWFSSMIRATTRLKDDAAMGIVLSVFYGMGIAILGMVQSMPGASAAGLQSYIYGKAASISGSDASAIAWVVGVVLVTTLALRKEFTLLSFDENFGRSQGWRMGLLDGFLLILVGTITVVGLQAVGLILMIALLIIPPSAARFWTNNLTGMLGVAVLIGVLSGWVGVGLSALLPDAPTGAVIVLVAACFFLGSMVFGGAKGMVPQWRIQQKFQRRIGRQHLLRAVYELQEAASKSASEVTSNRKIPLEQLVDKRSWGVREVRQLLKVAEREDHLEKGSRDEIRLSEAGFGEASRVTRNHRLWELYLIHHAEIAASHVDRDADMVEHLLSPEMVRELELRLEADGWPESPHPLERQGEGAV